MRYRYALLSLCIFLSLCGCQSNNLATSTSPSPEPNPSVTVTVPVQSIITAPPSSGTEPTGTIPDSSDEISPSEPPLANTPDVSPPAVTSPAIPTAAPSFEPEPTPEPSVTSDTAANSKLFILMYHHVVGDGEECNEWTITVSRLREDLQWLADNGYTTVLPCELKQGKPLPEKAVMITFDDGYTSNYTLAFPLLQEFGAKAVISLIVSKIDWGVKHAVTWEMCREMQASGLVEFGSHTYDLHQNGIVRNQDESQADYINRLELDISKSVDLMRDNLGSAPCFFAYPFGRTEKWASTFLENTFFMTVTCEATVADISDGTIDLPRYNINMQNRLSYYLD